MRRIIDNDIELEGIQELQIMKGIFEVPNPIIKVQKCIFEPLKVTGLGQIRGKYFLFA